MSIIKNRKYAFILSSVAVLLSLYFIFQNGFNYGIDFTGGSLVEIQASETNTKEILSRLEGIENSKEVVGSVQVQSSESNTYIVRTRELNDESHTKVIQALSGFKDYKEVGFTRIGPVVGEHLKVRAIQGVAVALLILVLFVWWSFRRIPEGISAFRFGFVAAVPTLIHDVIITMGVFAWRGLEIDSFFITAILTVFGFSINDTIVVFDRIREALIRRTHTNFEEVCEYAVKSTFRRSLNTSLTILLTLFALYFFASPSIKNFVLALIIGIGVGTYSSLFVATPLLLVWENLVQKNKSKVVVVPKKKKK